MVQTEVCSKINVKNLQNVQPISKVNDEVKINDGLDVILEISWSEDIHNVILLVHEQVGKPL